MTRSIAAALLCMVVVAGPARPDKYAVVVSAEYTYEDNKRQKGDFWYGLYLAYEALINHGFTHDHVTVLYNMGEDFESKYPRFQNAWSCANGGSITDLPMDPTTFESVLDSLADVVGSDDTLVVWWAVGHGEPKGPPYYTCGHYYARGRWKHPDPDSSEHTWSIVDTVLGDWLCLPQHYALRVFLWSTCNSGGLLDDVDGTDSTVALASVQYGHRLGSYLDTLFGTSVDTISVPAFTAFASFFMNRHDIGGGGYDADRDDNTQVELDELKYAVDSMYKTSRYVDPGYGTSYDCCGDPGGVEAYDTVQLLDPGPIAARVDLTGKARPSSLRFRYGGTEVARITDAGYVVLRGVTPDAGLTGLRVGPSVAIHTDGDLVPGDSLLSNRGTWLDTADLTGSLVVRNGCGTVVGQVSASDSVKIRAWPVQEFIEMQ
jgi:hypothetical protein